MVTRSDFDGDGNSDILWRGPNGQVALWEMDGAELRSSSLVEQGGHTVNPGNLWTVVQSGDFNADGLADLLWRGPDGEVALWNMDGPELLASSLVMQNGHPVNPGHNWTILGTGDFNGDGHSDILWRSTPDAGAVHIWDMDNETILSNHPATHHGGGAINPGSDWQVAGIGDFNGDGLSDILWQSNEGQVGIWTMNDTEVQASSLITQGGHELDIDSNHWSVAGTADFNGDGMTDILWRGVSGEVGLWLMDDSQVLVASSIKQGTHVVNIPNNRWSIEGTGDYTGDGKADVLLRGSEGETAIWTLNGAQLQSHTLIHDANGPLNVSDHWQIAPTT
jgi:hypothetical protein